MITKGYFVKKKEIVKGKWPNSAGISAYNNPE